MVKSLIVRVFWFWWRLYDLRDVTTIVDQKEDYFTGQALLNRKFGTWTAGADSRRIWWSGGISISEGEEIVLVDDYNVYLLYLGDDNRLRRKVLPLEVELPMVAGTYVACRVSAEKVRDRVLAYSNG